MMYCDQPAMVARFGEVELTRLTDSGDGQMDSDAVNAALSDASDEIDTYLAVQHDLPLESTPEVLVRLCADIARYRLYDDRMLDEVKKRYDDAIKLLKEIAKGSAVLPITGKTASSDIDTVRKREDRVFTSESLEGY